MNHSYNYIKILFSISFLFFALTNLQAQDPHFSQFYSAPTQMNPALTGVFSGEYRFVANYRTQNYAVLGTNSYKTIAASFEGRRRVGRDDYFSFGLSGLKDQVAESNFKRVRAVITTSYLKHLGGNRYRSSDQYLVGGAQLGIGQWSFDSENLWFSQQFDLSNNQAFVNTALATGENLDEQLQTDMFTTFNAGLLYYNVLDDNNSFYFGGAMNHLTEPNVSFTGDVSEKLHRRWLAQIGGELSITRDISLLPAAAVMGQGPSFLAIGGMSLRYNKHDWREIAIRAGLWGRVVNNTDKAALESMVVSTILEVERWQFGLSYDITTSNLSDANNSRGAFELSLIYTHPTKERFSVNCPRF